MHDSCLYFSKKKLKKIRRLQSVPIYPPGEKLEPAKQKKKKKKKKKKKVQPAAATGVLVVDEDPVWQKPVKLDEEEAENDSADEEKPIVDEDIEVKRMRRLELIKSKRAYNAIAEDGSGWVSLSPKRSRSVDLGSDMSPPRKRRTRNDSPSPELEGKVLGSGAEAADLSPPRRRRTPSLEPDGMMAHFDGQDLDLSPPRRRQRTRNDTPEAEPESKANLSPPRQQRRRHYTPSHEPDKRTSPPIRQHSTDNVGSHASLDRDMSPLRKSRKALDGPSSSKQRPKTGLITGRDISEEISKTKKEDKLRFLKMDPSESGRGAEPVYRDKKGDRISKDEYSKLKQKVEEKPKEKKLEWGKGLAQKREAEARFQELELEKERPFARTRDDPELDKMLKERIRWSDPMAHLVKLISYFLILLAKFIDCLVFGNNAELTFSQHIPSLRNSEKMKESGFIILQDILSHSRIKRGLDAAPNR
uniref:BUD13 homolog n=1 Tax=Rhizophora mucronata TaxID=61149 RepID=A0A2P2JWX8_RHIMU